MANRVKKGVDIPICYPRLVRTASTRLTSRPSAGLKRTGSGWAVSCVVPNTR